MVAGAAVERVDLTVRSECVQDVVAVATELVVDAAAAPEEVALEPPLTVSSPGPPWRRLRPLSPAVSVSLP